MTERERWIVYPLLILGLGASLKDKLVAPSVVKADKIECNQIQCKQQIVSSRLVTGALVSQVLEARQLVVVDEKRQAKILMRAVPVRLRVFDQAGKLTTQIQSSEVGKQSGAEAKDQPSSLTTGNFELFGPESTSVVSMGTLEEGGFVAVAHEKRRDHVMLNYNRLGSGLFVVGTDGNARPLQVAEPVAGAVDDPEQAAPMDNNPEAPADK